MTVTPKRTIPVDDQLDSVEAAIGSLRTSAPASLLPRTMRAVGLADGYARVESPVGPVFVAFNTRGVSAVSLAGDPGDFEADFRRDHRATHRAGRRAAAQARSRGGPAAGGRSVGARAGRPARPLPVRGGGPAKGAGDPDGRSAAVRLDRRRDRPPEGGPGRRNRPRPQPDPAAHPVPPGRPERRAHRPVLDGRPRGEAARADLGGARPRAPASA